MARGKDKKKRKLEKKQEGDDVPKKIPHTLESLREKDETMLANVDEEEKLEVILNNFSTRLGLTVGRMLGALFHYEPQFRGRRAVTFHNQRDYIFFRHHRYEFTSDGRRAKLRELGPRFTLKLISLQQGTFDSKRGDYEWIIAGRRHQMETSRRKFFL
ncbi:hypothetical protein HF086_000534 [Spodoptera exigua]|uniref:Brix domain-containing protein n=1 Tax=Spodoptera exigua TaxID=7107 RepID=A0A922MQ76_SPOEX|nr:hypothetical protein HF086_000534 [Spodoptera exigua]